MSFPVTMRRLFTLVVALATLHECSAFSPREAIKHLLGLQHVILPTQIGIIKLNSEINDESAETMLKKLAAFTENSAIRGVILIISSGGGDAGLSELLRREVEYLAEQKPVVVLVGGACCSGAYETALGANWIVSPSKAVVGSIGVYTTIEKHINPKVSPTGYAADVVYEILRAGQHKLATHPHGPSLDDATRALIQERINSAYMSFCTTVAEKRNLSLERLSEWGEGRVFSGAQALTLGLIDQIGGFSDAIKKLKALIAERTGSVVNATVFVS